MNKNTQKKKAEDILLDFSAAAIGTVWGINAAKGGWTDEQMTLFNNKVVDARNEALSSLKEIKEEK